MDVRILMKFLPWSCRKLALHLTCSIWGKKKKKWADLPLLWSNLAIQCRKHYKKAHAVFRLCAAVPCQWKGQWSESQTFCNYLTRLKSRIWGPCFSFFQYIYKRFLARKVHSGVLHSIFPADLLTLVMTKHWQVYGAKFSTLPECLTCTACARTNKRSLLTTK